jgi:hypothetical protein
MGTVSHLLTWIGLPCDSSAVELRGTRTTGQSQTVTCADGHAIGGAVGGASSLTFVCAPSNQSSAWLPEPSPATLCQPVTCPNMMIANSNTPILSGVAGASARVSCVNGFSVNGTNQLFVDVSCAALAGPFARWSVAVACLPAPCPVRTLRNSTVVLRGSVGDNMTISCLDDGFGVLGRNQSSALAQCVPAVGASGQWTVLGQSLDSEPCRPVSCPPQVIPLSASISAFVQARAFEDLYVQCDGSSWRRPDARAVLAAQCLPSWGSSAVWNVTVLQSFSSICPGMLVYLCVRL